MSEQKLSTYSISIQDNFPQPDDQLLLQKHEYIANLQTEASYQKIALTTAQNLIQTYRVQNEYLVHQNERLKSTLYDAEKKGNVLEAALANSNYHQKSLLELSEQVTSLLEKQAVNQRKSREMNAKVVELERALARKQDKTNETKKIMINRDAYNLSKMINGRKPIVAPVLERTKDIRNSYQELEKKDQQLTPMKKNWDIENQMERIFSKKNHHSGRIRTANSSIEYSRERKHRKEEHSLSRYLKVTNIRK